MPVDVRGYAFHDSAFPAGATADRLFTQSQCESYRGLGEFIGDGASADAAPKTFLDKPRALPA